jgi:hypothetical protein
MPDDKKPDPKPAAQPDPTPPTPTLPTKIRITAAEYGFWEGEGASKRYRGWKEGEDVTDPAEVALLVERGAPFVVAE